MPDQNFRDDILTPLSGGQAHSSVPKRSFVRDMDWAVYGLSVLAALISFGLSCYFFYGFWETDQGLWTLLNSAVLCFGVGLMGYGPALFMAIAARRALRGKVKAGTFYLAILIALPWVLLSLIFCFGSALPLRYGLAALVLSLIWLFWSLFWLRRLKKH